MSSSKTRRYRVFVAVLPVIVVSSFQVHFRQFCNDM